MPGSALAQKCIESCRAIATFTEVPGTITRTFLCDAMRDCQRYLREQMQAAGMQTGVDAAGNLRGVYAADREDAPRLVIGSHLDTVPCAGAFDGVLGVVLGIALIEALGGERLPLAVEVVGFSEEEGVRFRMPFIGSRAFTGTLNEQFLRLEDSNGISVAEAITHFGLDVSVLPAAVFHPRSFGYVEFHIEQGPVLASLGQPLAVVEAISGQSRATVSFEGQTNHAGTTPMAFRHDALTAAAEWIGAVERYAGTVPGLVATVGKLDIAGAATNVIPGKVTASLDVRHGSDDTRKAAVSELLKMGEATTARRGLRFFHSIQTNQNTVAMDARLLAIAEESLRASGVHSPVMSSGAGHDAMIIGPVLPSVMFFLRSPNGISHDPAETVLVEDVACAIQAGLDFLKVLGSTLPYE